MIVKIFDPVAGFGGVSYNTRKIDRNKGELMKTANFGPLQALNNLRPQDYVNYLTAVSRLNKNTRYPQFHATISAKGRTYGKNELTGIAESWLKEMGYGAQPYLVVFHKDTLNNHVHVVSTRISKDGRKISSAFEGMRAQRSMRKILGYEHALQYRFSTRAQFFMILEAGGYPGTDPDEAAIRAMQDKWVPDKRHAAKLAAILRQYRHFPDFPALIKDKFAVDLVFHAAEGKKPYGYSVIDHENKIVFKGSEVLPLKELLAGSESRTTGIAVSPVKQEVTDVIPPGPASYVGPVSIADDVDDQQIHGMRRRRQKKARTNTR